MNESLLVLFWWILFAGTHIGLSSAAIRPRAVGALGEQGFLGLYALVSFATFVPLGWTYAHHRGSGPLLWNAAAIPGAGPAGLVLGGLGWVLVVLSLVQPSPVGLDPRATPSAHGVTRITRHPMFAGLGLWGLSHALLTGFLTDVIFFGGFALFGLFGGAHQDARKRLAQPDRLGRFYAETSLLPFAAILTGRTRFAPGEISPMGLAAGIAVAAALYLGHGWMFR